MPPTASKHALATATEEGRHRARDCGPGHRRDPQERRIRRPTWSRRWPSRHPPMTASRSQRENVWSSTHVPNASLPSPCNRIGSETRETSIAQALPNPTEAVFSTTRRRKGLFGSVKPSVPSGTRRGRDTMPGLAQLHPRSEDWFVEPDESAAVGEPGSMLPSVTVVLPTLNERSFIRDALDSLLRAGLSPRRRDPCVRRQLEGRHPREIVKASASPVLLIDNIGVTAAAGMNVGIRAAVGDVICRARAHAVRQGLRGRVEVLLETGGDNVGGRMRPVGTTAFGRAVAAVTSSRFGVGPGRFHYADAPQEVDTVYLGCWRTRDPPRDGRLRRCGAAVGS